MPRPYPPAIFTLTLYLVVLKDVLRVVEFTLNLPFPVAGVTAAVLVVLIWYNVIRAYAQRVSSMLGLGWIAFIAFAFTSVSFHLLPQELVTMRDFFGITVFQLLIPVAAISSAIAYDLTAYMGRSGHVRLLAASILAVSLAEIAYIMVAKDSAATILLNLYKAGLISYPIQAAGGAFNVRAPGLFYSAFALALFCVWVVAMGLFSPVRRKTWITLSIVSIVILAFTINRNGIIMCGIVMLLRLLFGSTKRFVRWKVYLAAFATACFVVAVPLVSLSTEIGGADESMYGKTSTMVTRANTWKDLVGNRWIDLAVGDGTVQGVTIKGREPVVVDNFFLYIALEAGVTALFIAIALLSSTVWRLSQGVRRSDWIRLYTALLLTCVIGFSLNIVFFEPIFQFLVLGPVISLLAITARTDRTEAAVTAAAAPLIRRRG